jgi:pilus assembly protein CpaB
MNKRATVLFGSGAVMAILTGAFAYRVVMGFQAEVIAARTPTTVRQVLVATRDLTPGQVIADRDVRVVSLPEDKALGESWYAEPQTVRGLVLRSPILAGEPLRKERFGEGIARSALSLEVAPGKRAVSVDLTRAASVGGELQRGDLVDVMVTIRTDTAGGDTAWVTETILQGVPVLQVGPEVADPLGVGKSAQQPQARTDAWLTLELLPSEGEKLAMAVARGSIHCALRTRADTEVADPDGPLLTRELVGMATPQATPRAAAAKGAPAAPEQVSEVIQGSDTTQARFRDGVLVASGGTR